MVTQQERAKNTQKTMNHFRRPPQAEGRDSDATCTPREPPRPEPVDGNAAKESKSSSENNESCATPPPGGGP